jgi:glycosyltransferase involved in cell wall biosynthesis
VYRSPDTPPNRGSTIRPKVCIIQYNSSRFLTRVDRSARALADTGWDVVLIAIKDAETPAYEERDGYVVKRVTLGSRALPRGFGLKFLRFAEGVWRTFAAAWREDADVYNPRDAYPLMAAHWAAFLRRGKVVYDSDELNLDRNWRPSSNRAWRFLMKGYEGHYARKSAAVITSDIGRAEVLAQRYGVAPTVVLNVPEILQAPEPDLDFRARALRGRRYLLMYQGILLPNRGLLEMVDAMRSLSECRFAIVGFGPLRPEIEEKIERTGLADSVEVFDAVPFARLMRYTAAADVGMVPIVGACLSYRLAAPNKLFECMMAGVPVVASDLPDMARVVRTERVGTLIADPTDPASIVSAVRALIDGPESLAEIGRRARGAALARYNWEIERPKLLAVYEELVPREGAGA